MTQHVSHYHSDQIRELHAEIEQLKTNCNGWYQQNTELIEHRDKVQDENKLLRAEIDRLRLKVPDRDKLLAEIERLTAERDAYHESNERLAAIVSGKNAEIEQLRAALQRILDATVDGDEMAAVEMAQRALEPKP
jgi:small-conductance mechanosensitive channel